MLHLTIWLFEFLERCCHFHFEMYLTTILINNFEFNMFPFLLSPMSSVEGSGQTWWQWLHPGVATPQQPLASRTSLWGLQIHLFPYSTTPRLQGPPLHLIIINLMVWVLYQFNGIFCFLSQSWQLHLHFTGNLFSFEKQINFTSKENKLFKLKLKVKATKGHGGNIGNAAWCHFSLTSRQRGRQIRKQLDNSFKNLKKGSMFLKNLWVSWENKQDGGTILASLHFLPDWSLTHLKDTFLCSQIKKKKYKEISQVFINPYISNHERKLHQHFESLRSIKKCCLYLLIFIVVFVLN